MNTYPNQILHQTNKKYTLPDLKPYLVTKQKKSLRIVRVKKKKINKFKKNNTKEIHNTLHNQFLCYNYDS